MKEFKTFIDKAIPLDLDNVDTDMIIPALHLTSTTKTGYGMGLFSNLKNMYPNFIFNNKEYNKHSILISKNNFGCGSSREHAVWALQQYGIKAIICSSFSDIFYNNAAKNGLLLIKLAEKDVNFILEITLENSAVAMTIDLEHQEVKCYGSTYKFEYNSFRKHCLINGIDDLDYLLTLDTEIKDYAKKHSRFGG